MGHDNSRDDWLSDRDNNRPSSRSNTRPNSYGTNRHRSNTPVIGNNTIADSLLHYFITNHNHVILYV
jgi:hypothetical protein